MTEIVLNHPMLTYILVVQLILSHSQLLVLVIEDGANDDDDNQQENKQAHTCDYDIVDINSRLLVLSDSLGYRNLWK